MFLGSATSHRLQSKNLIDTTGVVIQPYAPTFNITWIDICSNGTDWVIVGSDSNIAYYGISSDLINWSVNSIATLPAGTSPAAICSNGTNYIVVCNSTSTTTQGYKSSNGTSWSSITLPAANWNDVTTNGSSFVAIATSTYPSGTGGTIAYSSNGTSWATATGDITPSYPGKWWSVGSNGSGYIVIANGLGDKNSYSSTGTSWTFGGALPSTDNNFAVNSNGTNYVTVTAGSNGNNEAAYTTNNGISWNANTLPLIAEWEDIGSNQTYYLAVAPFAGSLGTVDCLYALSTNGTTWQTTSSAPYYISRISGKGLPFNSTGNIFGGIALGYITRSVIN